jgi:hypothetical protein
LRSAASGRGRAGWRGGSGTAGHGLVAMKAWAVRRWGERAASSVAQPGTPALAGADERSGCSTVGRAGGCRPCHASAKADAPGRRRRWPNRERRPWPARMNARSVRRSGAWSAGLRPAGMHAAAEPRPSLGTPALAGGDERIGRSAVGRVGGCRPRPTSAKADAPSRRRRWPNRERRPWPAGMNAGAVRQSGEPAFAFLVTLRPRSDARSGEVGGGSRGGLRAGQPRLLPFPAWPRATMPRR